MCERGTEGRAGEHRGAPGRAAESQPPFFGLKAETVAARQVPPSPRCSAQSGFGGQAASDCLEVPSQLPWAVGAMG